LSYRRDNPRRIASALLALVATLGFVTAAIHSHGLAETRSDRTGLIADGAASVTICAACVLAHVPAGASDAPVACVPPDRGAAQTEVEPSRLFEPPPGLCRESRAPPHSA
jgi:hypothetical protein